MKPILQHDLTPVGDHLYEIAQSFRPDMRVPARLYADQDILAKALEDRSLEQLVNTATLPGVVGYALAMPDIHQGYGFPIGGVAATLLPHGVVSPGGVGYDINCLHGDSRVLNALGFTRAIAEMETDWPQTELACQDFAQQRASSTRAVRFLKQRPSAPVYRVYTESGDEVIATADHPFWTPDGMVELGKLAVGARVALAPFEGVGYQPAPAGPLVTEAEIRETLKRREKKIAGNATEQIFGFLRRLNLLPLNRDSAALPYLIRIAGFVIGDGHIHYEGGDGKGVTWFYGEPDDLEELRRDIQRLGITPSRVYTRQREHHIVTQYGEYDFSHQASSFKVVGSAFALLLETLGVPVGNKTQQDFRVPEWLYDCPLWQQRLFLAGLFGAEMSAPKAFNAHGANFYTPVLAINKREGYLESGIRFMEDIARLLQNFGIRINKISAHDGQESPHGAQSQRVRLIIASDPDTLIHLWGRVGYDYNRRKRVLAGYATQYLKRKARVLEARQTAAREAVAMHAQGATPTAIYGALATEHTDASFLEHSLYRDPARKVRAGNKMATFEQYRAWATQGLKDSGMVWEQIAKIEPVDDVDVVYDFTVEHPDHNFVANSFVVSNCGIRLVASHLDVEEARPHMAALADALYRHVPGGVGVKGQLHINKAELDRILADGSQWAQREGYATPADVEHTEHRGCVPGANPDKVSPAAKQRGQAQVGTLGSGNHFAEIDVVSAIYDAAAADALGLRQGQIAVQLHCGSRGLGHQVATDYIASFQKASRRFGFELPDRQLVCAPLDSREGQDYLAAMNCAANYAWANRQVLTYRVREAFAEALAGRVRDWSLSLVYDVAHNMAKIETHQVGGRSQQVCVHRKGATRAFGPGHPDLPEDYRAVGQPVLVPGSMGTASYVLVGAAGAMAQTFGSCCHGAGRVLSRAEAKRQVRGEQLRGELAHEGIVVRAGSLSGLAEEAPQAYKDVDQVVAVVEAAGLARIVARLEPLAVVKG
ncbi:MAG: RNA-splicing ligase RtcB [Chloroflexi bacterium ADurb.Bin325]|nr:MAG: RNA-splicing ligase RtcB [Chloroflexi bacterium ADurb.Bin325]